MRGRLDQVERWWPAGYGDQALYRRATCELAAPPAGRSTRPRAASASATVRWNTSPTPTGTPFTLVVNDQPVFVKGANWIPDDAFPVRVDRARYRQRLAAGEVDADLNLIRVWGGGIYEADDFYELCDELGLLTWQDFLFACAAYAEEEPLRSRGRGGGPRERRAPRRTTPRSCCSPATTRTCGATRTGAGSCASTARRGAPTTTTSCSRRSSPSSHRTCRTPRAARSARGWDDAPERPDASHGTDARLGPLEPEGLAALPRPRARDSSPSSAGRARRPGRRSPARSATTR